MARIVAVTACPTGIAHTFMAAEALTRAAQSAGHDIHVEAQGAAGAGTPLSAADIARADVVILAADTHVNRDRFAGKRVVDARTADAIRDAAGVLNRALGEATPVAAPTSAPSSGSLRIVGITACPTGIAHTFMAAEGLENGAKALGHHVRVETQGSVGAGNALTPEEVANADLVIIAADTNVDLSRFAGKRVYQTGTKPAIHNGQQLVQTALAEAKPHGATPTYADAIQDAKAARPGVGGIYKDLMTGVSHMLPLVVAGGLLIALAFAIGSFQYGDQGIFIYDEKYAGTLGYNLFQIGAKGAFGLFVPVLAGYIAYSIADRPGLAPGLVGGFLAGTTGSGFLGGIAAGFIAGYLVKWLNRSIRLPRTLEGLKPTLLLPLLGTLGVGLLMIYVVGTPVAAALKGMTAWLQGLGQSSAGLLGAVLGGMMAFDMGGPINKAAYTFSTGLLGNNVYGPIAATMAAGMTPPLAIALATTLFKNRFTPDEREAGKAAAVLGISFITEGAIPFAARDPLRVIPAMVAGSALAGAISMAAGCQLRAPHGGIFVMFIPNAVTHVGMYAVAIIAGTILSTVLLGVLKKPLVSATPAPVASPDTTPNAVD
ncbi:PTS fructose-like transporter subunit IIB [Deinococcus maricopensis]|uniref:PTS system, fructose subfamily, IIC subunit n=1 Tax=Deinococcus maricopensis (strain DSM 21211 / LMG 22137 / NRRL B-23946 / LB-34) TaxID=709986 RepID=E8U926_DEIML|nr:PTS fructose-like transporter subunit IIB [Deinococcus maricopensis]ADV67565.1 PTS system, fructose subfamily, IIC subunit [Deinococcus maricopensis DSM 21211]